MYKKKDMSKGGGSTTSNKGSEMYKKKHISKGRSSTSKGGSSTSNKVSEQEMDIRSILKDIELLGSSNMTWKERKALQNRKIVSLGGKPPSMHRRPLSVARGPMKKQKEREEQMLKERLILGRIGAVTGSDSSKRGSHKLKPKPKPKPKPKDGVLNASEGRFRNGVLDVKHLLRSASSRDNNAAAAHITKGPKGSKGPGNRGGGGRKFH